MLMISVGRSMRLSNSKMVLAGGISERFLQEPPYSSGMPSDRISNSIRATVHRIGLTTDDIVDGCGDALWEALIA